MKRSVFNTKPLSAILAVLVAAMVNNAMAQNQYFTTVANGGTYSWDGANWNASGSAGNTSPYTFNWTAGNFARFYNGAGDNFTVTVNASESMAGLFLNAGASAQVNINDAGSNTGSLSIVPNATLQDGFGFTQGFLTGGGIVAINAPITGTGGVEEESGGGHLQLYGNNSYSGGTLFTSSSTFVDYNNNNSFGSGNIGYFNTTFSIMNNTGPSSVVIGNNVQILGGTTGVNFIGNSATMSGTWAMGAFNVNIRNNGVGTIQTLSGVMTGTGAVNFSGANGGKIKLTGANNITGPISIGSSGDTAVTLVLGAANTIASSSGVTLAGGTLDLGGNNHTMASTVLGLTSASTFLFDGGNATFGNSSAQTWSGVLDLADWTLGTTSLEFGTDATGLTSGQLADIEFNNNPATLGTAFLNANGYVVPEPSTVSLAILGGLGCLGLAWKSRRKA